MCVHHLATCLYIMCRFVLSIMCIFARIYMFMRMYADVCMNVQRYTRGYTLFLFFLYFCSRYLFNFVLMFAGASRRCTRRTYDRCNDRSIEARRDERAATGTTYAQARASETRDVDTAIRMDMRVCLHVRRPGERTWGLRFTLARRPHKIRFRFF